jgi:hypothetical protein
MAKVVGESGAWREIAVDLQQHGYSVDHPNSIAPLLTRLRETYQSSVDQKKSEIAQSVAIQEKRIASLRTEKGFWRSIVNSFRILKCKREIEQLQAEERYCIAVLDGDIERLDMLRASRELVGARAELEVISRLSRLPGDYTVFNDIRLTTNRYIRFDGAALRSAQIDHLVLSPAGVFVIETKRWSQHFVESGEYHNPFNQIQRAAYLCYKKLRREFGKIHVRSVIACAGKLPSAPENSHVKVLPIAELNGYISWFKQPELTPERLWKVYRFLKGFVRGGESLLSTLDLD